MKRNFRSSIFIFLARIYLVICGATFFALSSHLAYAEPSIKYFGVKEGRIAFAYQQKKNIDIYVLDFKTREIKPVVATAALEEYPSFSPDGSKIAFYSNLCGSQDIFTVNADGSNLARLTNHPGADEDPDWSPDGTQIVFQSDRRGDGANLFVMKADGSDQQPLTELKKMNTVPKWSPRGDEILYSTNRYWPGWDVMLFDVNTKKSKKLTDGFQSYCRGNWNPDGGSFAFSHGGGSEIDIWIHNKGSGTAERLTSRPGKEYDPAWLEDGKRLFFVSELEKDKGNYQLFLVNTDDKEPVQVTDGEGSVRQPTWSSLPAPPSGENAGNPQPTAAELKSKLCL